MQNELKVFYTSEKGLMTHENNKIVFQHKDNRDDVKIGLGIIHAENYYDKGNYAFAVFENVKTVVPTQYKDIRFFVNKGVPIKIERGYYGDNVLLKETYKSKTYIRAYKEDGSIGFYECDFIKNKKFTGKNIYFTRLNEGLIEWEDITDTLVPDILKSVDTITGTVELSNPEVVAALKGLTEYPVYRLKSGIIIGNGKFESIIIWGSNDDVKMSWLGRKYDVTNVEHEDLTEEFKPFM